MTAQRATPTVVMASGAAPPIIDGVGDHAARMVDELARGFPHWRWWHLARRPGWLHAPLSRRGRVRVVRANRTWTPAGTAAAALATRLLKPRLLHIQDQAHSFYDSDAALRLADASRGKLVVTLHEWHDERPSIAHTIALARRADALIANDQRTFDRCVAATGRTPDLLGWSPSNVEPLVSPAFDTSRLATFGQINALKQLGMIGQALRGLVNPQSVHWSIVGPFAPQADASHRTIERELAGLPVTFTGALSGEPLRQALSQAGVMLLPFADGAALRRTSLATAWAFGHVVITTPPTANEPAIVDGDNCLLVPPGDSAAWAFAIERVRSDTALAARLRAGSLRTAERYGWPRLARAVLQLYDRLMTSS